jgi:hypothetical protein
LDSQPNVWVFILSLIGQEPDSRRVLMHNATGMDITVNQSRDERIKDNNHKTRAVMLRLDDLFPVLYMSSLS